MVDMKQWLTEVENLKDNYHDLYLWFLDEGLDKGDALGKIRDVNRLEEYYWKFTEGINLQISYNTNDLKDYGWGEMGKYERENLLWNLGVDVRNFNYYTEERRVMEGTSLKMKEVVWGNERLDKEWCTKKKWDFCNFTYYASDEARSIYRWRKKN